MSGTRVVVERLPETGSVGVLEGEEAAHARARRLRPGDEVVLIDGSGREARARVIRSTARRLEARVESISTAAADALPPIVLAVSAIRAERLAWIAEKATELGAARLTIISSERTQRFRAGESLSSRLERVVREAAKQSQRARWPQLRGPISLSELVRTETSANRLVLDSRGEPFSPTLPASPTALLVGPEGGWSAAELNEAILAGWSVVSLAAGTLRAETAAVAALALARAALARGPELSPLTRAP